MTVILKHQLKAGFLDSHIDVVALQYITLQGWMIKYRRKNKFYFRSNNINMAWHQGP